MLPRIKVPTFPYTLPVTKKDIHYRSFTVKEEKILLLASESQDEADMINAFKQVIQNCVIEELDVGKLPIFDLEVLFILLRIASVSPVAEFSVKDNEDEQIYTIKVDLKKMLDEVTASTTFPDRRIQLTADGAEQTLGVIMKDINLDVFSNQALFGGDIGSEQAFDMIANMIAKVYDEENVYDTNDVDKQEVIEFLEGFTGDSIQKLYEYMDKIPRVRTTATYTTKAGETKEMKLEGIADFFQFA